MSTRGFVVLVTSAVLCLVGAGPACAGVGDLVGLADGEGNPVNRPEYSHNCERGIERSILK